MNSYFYFKIFIRTAIPKSILLLFFLMIIPPDSSAQNGRDEAKLVRGKVISMLPDNSIIPAVNFKLTLHLDGTKNFYSKPFQSKYTGSNGFYYFENIPFGKYILVIWKDSKFLLNKYEVTVSRAPFNDVPPIYLKADKIKTGTSL